MSQIATQQLDAIHSMLSAGHRNLRIERHSLLLWGLAGGALCLFSDNILTLKQFPLLEQRALAWLLLLTVVFGGVGMLDWHLTRRAKQARDEALSFIHRQVLKVWWLLIGMGILVTFAMFFFGGGYMLFPAWLIFIGLGLYVHGLFSEELLEWIGSSTILISVLSLGFHLPLETIKWIAAAVFGIGLPMLALMLDRGRSLSPWKRIAQTLLWSSAVLVLPLVAQHYATAITLPETPAIPLASFLHQSDTSGLRIVSLPAGALIPVEVEITGNLFDSTVKPVLPLKLSSPLEMMIEDGKLTGAVRTQGGNWLNARDTILINIPGLKAELTPANGPVIRGSLEASFKKP